MSYLKSTRPTSLKSTPPPPPPFSISPHSVFFTSLPMWLTCSVCQKTYCVWGWCRGVTGSVRSDSHALLQRHGTWSQITGTPPQNTAQQQQQIRRLRSWLPVCLPTFDIAGCKLWMCQRDALSNHTGFSRRKSHPSESLSLSLFFCFSSHPIGVEATKVFLATS